MPRSWYLQQLVAPLNEQ